MTDFFSRQHIEAEEQARLAVYACYAAESRGRVYPESDDMQRTCFQRDRDRIMHCKAFRRLQGKTQVFIAGHRDHYRTRLTHSNEVAQIARTLARNLCVNEDLTETIALAHDLGHTPFGHAGEDAVRHIMQQHQSDFEHNQQSRRVVEVLERYSDQHLGLNLTWETLDGMHKHRDDGDKDYSQGSLEAQIVDLSDAIAYLSHDVDDGLRSGLFTLEAVSEVDLVREVLQNTKHRMTSTIFPTKLASGLIKLMADDLLRQTIKNLDRGSFQSHWDICRAPDRTASYDPKMVKKVRELKAFLMKNFYHHDQVAAQMKLGQEVIVRIFEHLLQYPKDLPEVFQDMLKSQDTLVVIKDFIAGMTDEYAFRFVKEVCQ